MVSNMVLDFITTEHLVTIVIALVIVVVTLGSEATPNLSQLVTRTNAIEINNLGKLLRMAV